MNIPDEKKAALFENQSLISLDENSVLMYRDFFAEAALPSKVKPEFSSGPGRTSAGRSSEFVENIIGGLTKDLSSLLSSGLGIGKKYEFSLLMPQLGKLDVKVENTYSALLIDMKTPSKRFKERLKAHEKKISGSISKYTGKKTVLRILENDFR